MLPLSPPFRAARIEDAAALAELVNHAGEGLPLYLWGKMAGSGESAWEVGRRRAARDTGSFSYRNATVVEADGRCAGCLIGYDIPDAPAPIPEDMPAMFVPLQELEKGLALAVDRGSLLRLDVERGAVSEALFTTNTPANRRAFEQIRDGRMPLGRPVPPVAGAPASQRENVFHLYEANIGPLTPLVAEELKEAEQLYPYEWLEEALREAALQNKRSWRYIQRILEGWTSQGREPRERYG